MNVIHCDKGGIPVSGRIMNFNNILMLELRYNLGFAQPLIDSFLFNFFP